MADCKTARQPETHLPPGVAQAVDYLRRGLAIGVWADAGRLPSIKSLAVSAGVSLVTMWKAVRALRDAGEVEVVHGKGIRISRGRASPQTLEFPQSPEQPERWRMVRRQIEHDILNGRFVPGADLPALKSLGHAYGASFRTLKQALSSLAQDGILSPCGRTYRVVPVCVRRPGAYVVLLGRGESVSAALSWTPWAHEWQRLLERECAAANIGVVSYLYAAHRERLAVLHPADGVETQVDIGSGCLGVLLRAIAEDDLHVQALHMLASAGVPVAVSDEGVCRPLPEVFLRSGRIRVFSISDGRAAGRKIARFLLERRCRRIAYLSPYDSMRWSRDRLAGLRETYAAAGLGDGVVGFTLDDVSFPFGFRPEEHPTEKEISAWTAAWYRKRGREYPGGRLAEGLSRAFVEFAESEALRQRLEPLFEEVLNDDTIRAWVCGNDRVAVAALEYLRRVHADSRIEVVGFDDTFDAVRYGFTSYNFNIPALVRAMLKFVVDSRLEQHVRPAAAVVTIEGFVVGREQKGRRYQHFSARR